MTMQQQGGALMTGIFTLALAVSIGLAASAHATPPPKAVNVRARDLHSDNWTALDGLGRTLPTYAEVGPPRPGKFVGMFYFLWLGQHGVNGPYDITRILEKDPGAMQKPDSPLWGAPGQMHHWGEPEFGYYISDDEWVYRKHALMLSEAGIDTVFFDVTNQATYPRSYLALCRAWSQIRKEGGKTPQIAFLTPFGDPARVVRTLYEDFYHPGLYSDLWFRWEGKPLILADSGLITPDRLAQPGTKPGAAADLDRRIHQFFTFRKPQPDYFTGPTGPEQWGWLEVYPQHAFYKTPGVPEQVTVGVAQNAVDGKLSVLSNPRSHGRSFHDGVEPGPAGQDFAGRNFAEQWRRALQIDPSFIFVTSWNEWVASRFGSDSPFYGSGPVTFVDEFDHEFSRDIEPVVGGHTDAYYYQLIANVRRFKGVRPPPAASGPITIAIDGDFGKWKKVQPEYRDSPFDTTPRNHPGWGSAGIYRNNSGRNDFVTLKVAHDARYIYFYARTREPITPFNDPGWMLLAIDTGRPGHPGWEGFDYLVNRNVTGPRTTSLEKSAGGWSWQPVSWLRYRVKGSEMELAIPRRSLGLSGASRPLRFDFKWMDNVDAEHDILNLYRSGDTAPDGRFRYHYEGTR